MQRLKDSWDREYPMHAHLNKKQLRQQATFVSSKLERAEVTAGPSADISSSTIEVLYTLEAARDHVTCADRKFRPPFYVGQTLAKNISTLAASGHI